MGSVDPFFAQHARQRGARLAVVTYSEAPCHSSNALGGSGGPLQFLTSEQQAELRTVHAGEVADVDPCGCDAAAYARERATCWWHSELGDDLAQRRGGRNSGGNGCVRILSPRAALIEVGCVQPVPGYLLLKHTPLAAALPEPGAGCIRSVQFLDSATAVASLSRSYASDTTPPGGSRTGSLVSAFPGSVVRVLPRVWIHRHAPLRIRPHVRGLVRINELFIGERRPISEKMRNGLHRFNRG